MILALIYQMSIKFLKARISSSISCVLTTYAASLLLLLLSTPSSYAGYAELDPGTEIEIDVNAKNKNRFYNLYNKSVIRPLNNGEPVIIDVAKPITANHFFRSRYCDQIGKYCQWLHKSATWCNKNYGPLRSIRFNPYALIVPITVRLDRDYASNAFYLLENVIKAKSVGTLKHAKYRLSQLSDYSFRVGTDLMLGIVNEKLNKMQLYKLDGFDSRIDPSFDSNFTNVRVNEYEIRIDLYGVSGRSLAGVNISRSGFSCANHAKCISDNSHHLEFASLDYAPKLFRHKKWGLITNDIFPPYYLSFLEEDGFQKIFLSRSFLLILDLDSSTMKRLKGVGVNVVSS